MRDLLAAATPRLLHLIQGGERNPDREPELRAGLEACLAELSEAVANMPGWRQRLERTSGFVPRPGHPLLSDCLASIGPARLCLVGISRISRVPLHDHPGSWGVSRVLKGGVLVRNYTPPADPDGTGGIVDLALECETLADPGTAFGFTPRRGNIHCLEAVTLNAVLLSLHLTPHQDGRPCWYFPVDLFGQGGPHLACCRLDQRGQTE